MKGQGRKQDINLNFKVIFGNTRGEQRGAGRGYIKYEDKNIIILLL